MTNDYALLVDATAEELFGGDKAGQPVYTLAEDDAIDRITTAAGLSTVGRDAFLGTVRDTLSLDGQGPAPLHWHKHASQSHHQYPLETPPSLPLLVVLTMAAESMQAGSNMASNNYYGRLFPLLKVPEELQDRLIRDYRNSAEILWGSLNSWLEAWEGERGVPTAYAMGGMRLIGLPMSQAIVRKHDRAGLHEAFALESLPPGFRMGAPDMELALDPYASKEPSPLSKNLRRLWAVSAARERIVQAACLELESWSGPDERQTRHTQPRNSIRLVAYVRTFPRKSIEFNLALPRASSDDPFATFDTPEGPVQIPTIPGTTGTIRLQSANSLNAESLLGNAIQATIGSGPTVERRPRRVVPLRWDELQGCYVEVERISLGEDNIILAMEDASRRVEDHVGKHARPGWERIDSVPGLPERWVLFRRVQFVSAPDGPAHVELLPLIARALTSLTLRGGFALPGRLRKWSSLEPPEVVALAAGAKRVSVRVFRGSRLSAEDVCFQVDTDGDIAIVALREHHLEDGEYTVAMFVDGAGKPASTATLRLRSANSPLFQVAKVDLQLVYSPQSAYTWPLSAGPPNWTEFVNGARVSRSPAGPSTASGDLPEYRPRARRASTGPTRQARLGTALPPSSCMVTGQHRFQLPPAYGGRPPSRSIDGECSTCGLVRRFAATPWAAKKRDAKPKAVTPVTIPPAVEHDETEQHIAFDALSHVGHGSYAIFERIANQIDGSGLFADTLLRRQEVTGHIDVRRDESLQAIEWAVNAATLVPVSENTWVLIGARSSRLVDSLRELVSEHGQVRATTDAGIPRLVVESTASRMVELREGLSALGIELLDKSPALDIASMLPPLTQIEEALKRIPVPAFHSLEIWETASASWVPATSLASTGAFRLRDFRSTYVIRSRSDLESGSVAIANAQLVKHIANRWAKDPLAGYHSKSSSVVVPLGADLPALYGRALSLCSGRAPRELHEGHMLQYPDVPREVASVVVDRLMN